MAGSSNGFLSAFGAAFSGARADGGPVSGITYVSKIPPKFHGVDVKVGSFASGGPGYFDFDTAHTPKALGFTMDLGSGAAVEADATQSTGIAVGSAHQTSVRASQGSLKVGMRPEAPFPWLGLQRDGTQIISIQKYRAVLRVVEA
jgi:hypothetical protein